MSHRDTHSPAASLTKLFGPLDDQAVADLVARIEVMQLSRGEILYREGDPGASMHMVLTGRLQVRVHDKEGTEKIVAYLSPGESVGEMALFTGANRAATVVAVRDTTLGLLTRDTFDAVMTRYPQTVFTVARLIIGRLTETQSGGTSSSRLRNIALVPIERTMNLQEFAGRLQLALLRFGTTITLDWPTVKAMLVLEPQSSPLALSMRLGSLLDDCEETHDYVICLADHEPTEWTRKCIGYADKILLVGAADASPAVSALETALLYGTQLPVVGEKELVLVHRDRTRAPSNSSQWLSGRPVDRHHHIPWRGNEGFNRLARRLSNNAVTLVLGGGGARGFAHIGVVRAIREAGIPIDAAGGTSFGALIAALVALGRSDEGLFEESKRAFTEGRPMDDYTLPVLSLVRGDRLAAILKKHYGGLIDDLWIPFFAVSSNLSRNRIAVHTRGELWRALRASVSLPGIFPPLIENGELLIDGGLLNNLPVDIMKEMVAGKIIAVDLSVEEEYRVDREAMPSAYEYLRAKLRGNDRGALDFPTLNRVLIKATTLGSSQLATLVKSAADLYLHPPVRDFDLLAWDRFHDIVELGYRYTKQRLNEWLTDHGAVVQRDEVFDSRLSRDEG